MYGTAPLNALTSIYRFAMHISIDVRLKLYTPA